MNVVLPTPPVQLQLLPVGVAARTTPLGRVSVICIGLAPSVAGTLVVVTSVAWLEL